MLEGSKGLVVRHHVASLVDASEGEVAILARLTVLHPVNEEGRVPGGLELLAVLVLHGEGDGLAAEPVTDVVGVTVDQGHAHGAVEDIFQVFDKVGPDEVTSLLEGKVDLVVGLGVVEVHTESIHDRIFGQVAEVVLLRSGIIVRVADVVDAATAKGVVWALYRRKTSLGKENRKDVEKC